MEVEVEKKKEKKSSFLFWRRRRCRRSRLFHFYSRWEAFSRLSSSSPLQPSSACASRDSTGLPKALTSKFRCLFLRWQGEGQRQQQQCVDRIELSRAPRKTLHQPFCGAIKRSISSFPKQFKARERRYKFMSMEIKREEEA